VPPSNGGRSSYRFNESSQKLCEVSDFVVKRLTS
jgi:hypothetical protein